MLDPLLFKPFLALILITTSCSLLGVFVLWKKLSFFGDGLSHSILLGFVLGAVFNVNQIISLLIFSVFFAFLVNLISKSRYFAKDTIIAIISYFSIALAIILNDFFIKNLNLGSYVFGDILAVDNTDLIALSIITFIAIFYIIFSFRKILLININADLAKVEGIKIAFWNISFLILLSLIIALSIKIVGILLMTALLILPAANARIFATSAKQMLILSFIFGGITAIASFEVANYHNLPIGPSIIMGFCLVFVINLLIKNVGSKNRSSSI